MEKIIEMTTKKKKINKRKETKKYLEKNLRGSKRSTIVTIFKSNSINPVNKPP